MKEMKRKRKRVQKERQKLNEKLNLNMVLKNDSGPTEEIDDLFHLQNIKNNQTLNNITEISPDVLAESENESDDEEKIKQKYVHYSEQSRLDSSGTYYKESDSELEMETDSSDDEDLKEGLGKHI